MLCMWMILINSLYNFFGVVFLVVDFDVLVEIVCDIDIVVLFDEVYEYIVYDGVVY